MKNLGTIILMTIMTLTAQAQDFKTIPTVSVTGEGKIKTVPDQVLLTVSIQSKGANSNEVKKENDQKTDAALKAIKKMNFPKTDYKTKNIYLNPSYDYVKKKNNYQANTTIEILVKDLNNYSPLIDALFEAGITTINNVEFKTSKLTELQTEARKSAVLDAQKKAADLLSPLNKTVGSPISISDNSASYYPSPRYYAMEMKMADAGGANMETFAEGEIEININVSISFEIK